MPIFDPTQGQGTSQGSSLSGLLEPKRPERDPVIGIKPKRTTVMEDLGLSMDQLIQPGQEDAQTPEGQALQSRVSGRRNTRVLEKILGEGTTQVQKRRKERLGIAETMDIKNLPGIEIGGTKKTAQIIQSYLQNLPSYAQRITGLEESVLASSSESSRVSDRFHEIASPTKKTPTTPLDIITGPPKISERFHEIADAYEEDLPPKIAFGPVDPFADAEEPATDFLRLGKSAAGGVIGSGVGALRGLEALTGKQIIGDNAPILQIQKDLEVENPVFLDKLASGFGSTVTFFIPGAGVAKGINVLSKGGRMLGFMASAGGVGVMSGFEALAESGEIYEQLLQDPFMTKEDAAKIANHGAGLNLLTLVITNALGFGVGKATKLKGILATAPMEAVQESLQTMISNYELGAEGEDILEGAVESGIIGLIVGGVIQGGADGFNIQRGATLQEKMNGGGNISTPDYVNTLIQRAQRDGVIGERNMLNLKPKESQRGAESESRLAGITGPEQDSSQNQKPSQQEARDIVEEIFIENKGFNEQVSDATLETDPTQRNAVIRARQAVESMGDPDISTLIRKAIGTKKMGVNAVAEIHGNTWVDALVKARENAVDPVAIKKLNDLIQEGQSEDTEEIDSDRFIEEITGNIERKKSGKLALEERKRLTPEELATFLETKPLGIDLKDEARPGMTYQNVIDALVAPTEASQISEIPDFLLDDTPLSELSPQGVQDAADTQALTDQGVDPREAVRQVSQEQRAIPSGKETQAQLGLGEKKPKFPNATIPEQSQFDEGFGFEVVDPKEIFDSGKPISKTLLDKLIDTVASAKPAQIQLAGKQTMERSKRAARLNKSLQKEISQLEMTDEERSILSKSLVSEANMPAFDTTFDLFSEAEITELVDHINTKAELENKPFDKLRARLALNKILSEGRIPQANEIDLLETIFGPKLSLGLIRKMSLGTRINKMAKEGLNDAKNIMATVDDSFLLRQGLQEIIRHPSLAAPAVSNGFRSMASREYTHNHKIQMESHPLFEIAKNAGLEITVAEGTSVSATNKEEEMGGAIFSTLSRVRGKNNISKALALGPRAVGEGLTAFNRLATVTINTIRFQSFVYTAEQMMEQGVTPQSHPNEYKRLAKMLNASTGRANISTEGEMAEWINASFWSPRFTLSRIESPMRTLYYSRGKGPLAIEARKRIMTAATYHLGMAYLLSLAADQWDLEAEIGLDPTKGNFLKLETANHMYDISAGMGPVLRLIAREWTAEEGSFGKEPLDEAKRFFRYRFSPIISAISSSVWGSDPIGKETSLDKEVGKLFVPLSIGETVESMMQHGIISLLYVLPAEFFGIGVTTLDGKSKPLTPEERKAKIKEDRANRTKSSGSTDERKAKIKAAREKRKAANQ
jgi:hypothetical protein